MGNGEGVRLGQFLEADILCLKNAQQPAFSNAFKSKRPSLRIYIEGYPEYKQQVYVKEKDGQGYVSKTVEELAKIANGQRSISNGSSTPFKIEDLVLLRIEQVSHGSIQLVLDVNPRQQC
ncbi:hypothetical protein WOLCODRAFT_148478 [Wolfiporia cocos MD-104 SS10]|uniref:Uncharacterized protein n=1 Tax=Wolfiporia cocos (strain MD-104) TaxID=742152 RepID=A0A2H3IWV0_WOLCO|nr:hypothetical protein WOLCODRAFT_148478 [Wolfiporia cocos MD-104 SS10]